MTDFYPFTPSPLPPFPFPSLFQRQSWNQSQDVIRTRTRLNATSDVAGPRILTHGCLIKNVNEGFAPLIRSDWFRGAKPPAVAAAAGHWNRLVLTEFAAGISSKATPSVPFTHRPAYQRRPLSSLPGNDLWLFIFQAELYYFSIWNPGGGGDLCVCSYQRGAHQRLCGSDGRW